MSTLCNGEEINVTAMNYQVLPGEVCTGLTVGCGIYSAGPAGNSSGKNRGNANALSSNTPFMGVERIYHKNGSQGLDLCHLDTSVPPDGAVVE